MHVEYLKKQGATFNRTIVELKPPHVNFQAPRLRF